MKISDSNTSCSAVILELVLAGLSSGDWTFARSRGHVQLITEWLKVIESLFLETLRRFERIKVFFKTNDLDRKSCVPLLLCFQRCYLLDRDLWRFIFLRSSIIVLCQRCIFVKLLCFLNKFMIRTVCRQLAICGDRAVSLLTRDNRPIESKFLVMRSCKW